MKIPIYQLDAFTDRLFGGNPAAVCPLGEFPDADLMQKIGMENNLSETAFLVPRGNDFDLRWFTPAVEVDLCGHATLASAHVILNIREPHREEVVFHTRSGALTVKRDGEYLQMDFPADPPSDDTMPDSLSKSLNIQPQEVFKGKTDYMLVYQDEGEVADIAPDFRLLSQAKVRGVIVTAPGENTDFVSRFFAPQSGVDEDPVTGSAHTTLTPYWAGKLGKNQLKARQISRRGGDLICQLAGNRVLLSGKAQLYLQGEIYA